MEAAPCLAHVIAQSAGRPTPDRAHEFARQFHYFVLQRQGTPMEARQWLRENHWTGQRNMLYLWNDAMKPVDVVFGFAMDEWKLAVHFKLAWG